MWFLQVFVHAIGWVIDSIGSQEVYQFERIHMGVKDDGPLWTPASVVLAEFSWSILEFAARQCSTFCQPLM